MDCIVGLILLPFFCGEIDSSYLKPRVLYLQNYIVFFLLKLLFASNHLRVLQVAEWGADGVIVGSAMVKILGEAGSPKEGLAALENFTNDMKRSIEVIFEPRMMP